MPSKTQLLRNIRNYFKGRMPTPKAILSERNAWVADCLRRFMSCDRCGTKLAMRHGDCPTCPKRKEKAVRPKIETVATFASSTKHGVFYRVTCDRRTNPPHVFCNCPGFVYNGKCWHAKSPEALSGVRS